MYNLEGLLDKIVKFDLSKQSTRNISELVKMFDDSLINIIQDIRSTEYMTVLFDLKTDDIFMELEVGKIELGYITEDMNGDMILYNDEVKIDSQQNMFSAIQIIKRDLNL